LDTDENACEFTTKKKIGMNKDGMSANNGRQICLMFRIERKYQSEKKVDIMVSSFERMGLRH
jgi:hypothetical protein